MNKVIASGSLALTKVLGFAKNVAANRSEIFNILHDYSGFGVRLLWSLSMQSLGSAIHDFLLSVAKPVLIRINFPVVVSCFLFAWLEVSMCLLVEIPDVGLLVEGALMRIKHLLGVLESRGWDTESNVSLICLLRPLVIALVALAEGFPQVRLILHLLDIIELVSQTLQILSRQNSSHTLTRVCLLAIDIARWKLGFIIRQAIMFLNFTRLIHM